MDKEDRAAIKAEKKEQARKKAEVREDKRKLKEDSAYINSASRVAGRFIWSIVEFILMFVLLSLVMDYLNTGAIDISTLPDTIMKYMKPGSVLFTALVSFLPIMILENIGVYFGLGSVPRMIFGLAKCIAILIWFNIVAASMGDIDIVEMSGMKGSSALQGLRGFTVNITPLVKLVDIIMLLSCIIPVGEFIGSRKRHQEVAATHETHVAKVQAHKDEAKAQKEAEKQAKDDAKAAKKQKSSAFEDDED